MPAPEVAEAAPAWAQVVGFVTAAGSLLGMFVSAFFRARKSEPEPASKVLLDNASMADIKPVLDVLLRISVAVEGTREDVHEMLKLARQEAEDDVIERKAELRAEALLAKERKAYEDRFHEDMARRLLKLPKEG